MKAREMYGSFGLVSFASKVGSSAPAASHRPVTTILLSVIALFIFGQDVRCEIFTAIQAMESDFVTHDRFRLGM